MQKKFSCSLCQAWDSDFYFSNEESGIPDPTDVSVKSIKIPLHLGYHRHPSEVCSPLTPEHDGLALHRALPPSHTFAAYVSAGSCRKILSILRLQQK